MSKILMNPGCPLVAMGTSRTDPVLLQNAIKFGIECGFRVIDTAAVYRNQEPLQKAISSVIEAGHVTRSDLYIISKSGFTIATPSDLEAECNDTLTKLNMPYLDLYLLHFPFLLTKDCTKEHMISGGEVTLVEDNLEMRWRGLEGLVEKGLVKEIGVSNFSEGQIAEILSFARIRPSVCECEAHPYFSNEGLVRYCESEGIRFMAYAPLGTPGFKPRVATSGGGHVGLMKEEVLVRIAERVGKSTAQVLIKWAIQRGTVPIVKTTSLPHVKDNLDLEGWELSEAEMRGIGGLERGGRVFTYMFAKHSKHWHYK